MQVALNYLILSGEMVENITRAVMVEKSQTLNYKVIADALLASVCEVKLEYFEV